MLPSKGYFNSLDCPFYLSSAQCFRPYCHFKHSKKDLNAEKPDVKVESSKGDLLVNAKPQLSLHPVVETVVSAPVKHIPIAYIPTKPSAISVNTKKPKSVNNPNLKNDASKKTAVTADYDPWSVIDSSEKTYSRYSYEKQDNDSEDELFKPLFDNSNQTVSGTSLGKFENDSKSGYDDETDDYPDGAEFSAEDEEDIVVKGAEEPLETQKPLVITNDIKPPVEKTINLKEIKCKKKRKYAEINASKIKQEETIKISKSNVNSNGSSNSPKRMKIDSVPNNSNDIKPDKKICKYKDKKNLSNDQKPSEVQDQNSDVRKHSSSNKKPSSEKNNDVNKHSNKHESKHSSSNHKPNQSEKKKSSSDSKKPSSDKKHSLSSKKSEDNKKHSHETKSSPVKSKKILNSDKHESKHSSDNKHHSSKSKHHSSSESKNNSSVDSKSHDSKSSSSNSKHHVSGKHSSVSQSKKQTTSDEKLKEKKNKENSSSSKESLCKNKSSKNKQDDKSKKTSEKIKSHSSSSKSRHKSDSRHGKDERRKLSSSTESNTDKHSNKNNLKRKHSGNSTSEESDIEKKEPILISDSSHSEESDDEINRHSSIVGIDDIEGLSDSDDHRLSELDNEEEYVPQHVPNSRTYPVYKPASNEDLEEIKTKFNKTPSTAVEEYKPVPAISKVRIAHVPNVSSLISAKSLINSGKTVPPALQRIVTATHIVNPRIPNKNVVSTSRQRPQITSNLDSNIALSIRQPGLNNIFDELIKFVDYDEACRRAVDEETEICNIATNPQSYRNRIALCILKIRKSKGAADVVKKEKITSASKPDYTYGLTLYECFSKYLLKPEDYVLHGYPLELPGKSGCVYIDKNSYFRNKHTGPREGPFRKCCNCAREYAVDEETNMPLTKNDCHHHWGKPIGIPRLGKTYTCCKGEIGSEPCHTSLYHVTETKNDDCLEGFVRTLPYPSDADPIKAGIYAMDCEMCYTTKGRDIVRVSLLSIDNESVYDVLIKPKDPILDYCTRFSGINEEKLENVTTTLPEVQKFILKLINDKTILVGHSLENDLKALKLIHYNVVDTSLMFPHKEGFPVKCALRTLTSRYLGQAIQTGENGHDSLEDARASLMLVLYQVKEDAKSRKPRVVKQLSSK